MTTLTMTFSHVIPKLIIESDHSKTYDSHEPTRVERYSTIVNGQTC